MDKGKKMKLKSIISALLIAALALSLVGCGSPVGKTVEHKNDEIGLAYTLPESMKYYPYGSAANEYIYRNTAGNSVCIITYHKDTALSGIAALEGDLSLENYVEYALEDIGITGQVQVVYNSAKTRASFEVATAESENEEPQYSYNLIIRGDEGIYIVQMLCLADDSAVYSEEYKQLAKKIYTY